MIELDRSEIESFLSSIGHGLHLCSIVPDGRRPGSCIGRWFGNDVVAATAWACSENIQGKGIYWTVNLVLEGLHSKPGKDDITAVRFAHVDIDPPKGGGPFDKVLKQAELLALPVPPSLIIDSGGGLQAFWRIVGPATLQAVEDVNINIAAHLGGDRCHSVDHLMRLPGSVNYPNKKKLNLGRVASLAKVIHDAGRIFH